MISNRAQILFKETPPLVTAHFKCAQDPFHPESNIGGYINFGTAENFLIEDLLLDKIAQAPSLNKSDLHYNYPWGSIELRKNYTEFLSKFLAIDKFDENDVSVGCGLSAVIESLSYTLFDSGDKVMTIAPLYNGFYHDFETRFQAKLILSDSLNKDGGINLEQFERDLNEVRPKVLLINNPHNPAGYTYTEDEIRKIITLSKELGILIIADEVYANSVFGNIQFISFLDKRFDDLNYTDSIIHLYGLAKDFALSGFKVGFFASKNKKITQAVQSLAYFHTVSTQTQHTANYLLSDLKWCEELFSHNNKQLLKIFNTLCEGLKKLGINHFPSDSGIFTMIDLSNYLKEESKEAEMDLFNYLVDELKISITPGQFFGQKSYGFFRVCYAKPDQILKAFLERLRGIQDYK